MAQPEFSGARLTEARQAAGLSEEDLAAAIGASSGLRIRAWESGEAERPRPRFVPLLARALGTDALTLLDVDPDDPPLAALRIDDGKTNQQLHEETGLGTMRYQRMESGNNAYEVDQDTVEALARAFAVTPDRIRAAVTRSRARRADHGR
ncbi:hypothetical protein BH20ACT5_BH20ACT5_08860 [soil metagenome]